jgi:hypothetical protein
MWNWVEVYGFGIWVLEGVSMAGKLVQDWV